MQGMMGMRMGEFARDVRLMRAAVIYGDMQVRGNCRGVLLGNLATLWWRGRCQGGSCGGVARESVFDAVAAGRAQVKAGA